jgi:uncharacterized membrane protein YeaQ/YmgE (transglycosylase-associated protein family)
MVKIVSIIGGLAGGWMAQQITAGSEAGAIVTLTTIAGAYVTGGFLGGAVRLIVGGRGNAAAGS